jgi:hypothetical protein
MYYLDEIELLDNLPKKDDIKLICQDSDWFYFVLKDDKRHNLFQILESLTRREFEFLAHKVISKLS